MTIEIKETFEIYETYEKLLQPVLPNCILRSSLNLSGKCYIMVSTKKKWGLFQQYKQIAWANGISLWPKKTDVWYVINEEIAKKMDSVLDVMLKVVM